MSDNVIGFCIKPFIYASKMIFPGQAGGSFFCTDKIERG